MLKLPPSLSPAAAQAVQPLHVPRGAGSDCVPTAGQGRAHRPRAALHGHHRRRHRRQVGHFRIVRFVDRWHIF